MIGAILLAAQIVVTASAPPLPPDEAVRVLRASRSIADRTDARTFDPPTTLLLAAPKPSSPTSGPFGEFRTTPMPVSYRGPFVHDRTPELVVHLKKDDNRASH